MIAYFIISFFNVVLHITRSILVIKSNKFIASLANCISREECMRIFSTASNGLSKKSILTRSFWYEKKR